MPNQNPRKPFPAWHLPKGMNKASDVELEKSIESCERWEWFGGGLVFIGVGAAVAIAAYHPKYDSFLEQWGSAVADGLVAIGVAIEIRLGQMAGLRQSELKRRSNEKVAEANKISAEARERGANALERAALAEKDTAEAKKQLQRLSSPRMPDATVLQEGLSKISAYRAQVVFVSECVDCRWLATWLAHFLRLAGWEILGGEAIPANVPPAGSPFSTAVDAGGQPWGVTILTKQASMQGPGADLISVLAKALPGEQLASTGSALAPDNGVRIVIAPRP